MKEVSEPEEGLSEIGMSEKGESRFWEIDELGCACWRKNAEIELDADLVLEKDNVCIGLHLKLYQRVTGWEGKVIVLFDECLDSQFRTPPTEEVELKLDNSFRYNNEKIWELVSEAVFKSVRVADVYGSSLFFCTTELVCLSQNVASIGFQYWKYFLFLATYLVSGSISVGSGIRMGLGVLVGVIAGATGIGGRLKFLRTAWSL